MQQKQCMTQVCKKMRVQHTCSAFFCLRSRLGEIVLHICVTHLSYCTVWSCWEFLAQCHLDHTQPSPPAQTKKRTIYKHVRLHSQHTCTRCSVGPAANAEERELLHNGQCFSLIGGDHGLEVQPSYLINDEPVPASLSTCLQWPMLRPHWRGSWTGSAAILPHQ